MSTADQMFSTCKALKELFAAEAVMVLVIQSKTLNEGDATGFAINRQDFERLAPAVCKSLESMAEVLRMDLNNRSTAE